MTNSGRYALVVIGMVAALSAGGALLAPSFAGEGKPATVAERQWLTIPQIHEKLEAAGYRGIEKIERERGGYEVRATDRGGARVKLYLNPQTGEVLGQGSSKRAERDGEKRSRDSADCNERRCRDDLAAGSPPPAPAPR